MVGLDNSLIQKLYKISLHTGYTKNVTAFDEPQKTNDVSKSSKDFLLVDFGLSVIRKATQRLNFYEFINLKRYLPHLKSIEQLILQPEYLGQIKVEVTGLPEQIENLTCDFSERCLHFWIFCLQTKTSIFRVVKDEKLTAKPHSP